VDHDRLNTRDAPDRFGVDDPKIYERLKVIDQLLLRLNGQKVLREIIFRRQRSELVVTARLALDAGI
jgi:hypothetical protein